MVPFPILTVIIFLPLVAGFIALATGRRPMLCRWISLGMMILELGLVCSLFFLDLQPHSGPTGTWLLVEDYPWIPSLGVRYSLGLDGVSQLLLLLTAFINVLCVLISWRAITTRVGGFHFFLFFLEASVMGLFLATDLLLFYLFWEVQLIPMFFLVGVWGHENRIHAAVKFVLFTLAGSLFFLIALIILYVIHAEQTGVYTFAFHQLLNTRLSSSAEFWLYAGFMIAFGIKIPLIPVHTWLPDTHTQAPTAGSLDLAGLLLKTGFYAFFRFAFPLFPMAARATIPLLIALGLVGIFYAAWIALAQSDIKRLVAYSSIGHMGMMVVGIAVWNFTAVSGSLLQMINHGITTSALFIMVGILYERTHTRDFADLGGLWSKMPAYSAFFLFFALSNLGLPGLNNFVGEILILVGVFQARPVIGAISFGGLVFSVIYVLRFIQGIIFGEPKKEHDLWDLTPREWVIMLILAVPTLIIGLHPGPVLRILDFPVHLMMKVTHLAGM